MAVPQKISQAEACSHLKKFRPVDPIGEATPETLCSAGHPFALDLPTGRLVYVLQWLRHKFWVLAAAGATSNATAQALQAIEQQAEANGATAVCFQTARPGLVKLARRSGYRVKGWILEKEVRHGSDA